MSLTVILQNGDERTPSTEDFQRWVNHAIIHLAEPLPDSMSEVSIRIVDKNESAKLNQEFRNKSGPTNILSFYFDPMPGFERESLGDIALCKEIIIEQALAAECEPLAHWAHLTVHGILHLFGYDHIQDEDAKKMEALEIDILNKLGFPDPYLDPETGKIHD